MATEVYKGTTKKSVSAAGVVFTGSSRLVRISVTTTGTGAFTIKDSDGTTTGDTVYSGSDLAAGTVVELDCPMDYGIDVTANGASQVTEFIYDTHKA